MLHVLNHYCYICGKDEYDTHEKSLVRTHEFWVCPECCSKLKELITPSTTETTQIIMRYHE